IVFTGIGEAQTYIGDQLAKMYDPKAGYSPSMERMITEFATGAVLGGGMGGATPSKSQQAVGTLYKQAAAGPKNLDESVPKVKDDQNDPDGNCQKTRKEDGGWSFTYKPSEKKTQAKVDEEFRKFKDKHGGDDAGDFTKQSDGKGGWTFSF